MTRSTHKTDAQLNKMLGTIQKGPSPTRITNPRGAKKNRILAMKKGDWLIDTRKEQKNWNAAGNKHIKSLYSCCVHPESKNFCIFEITK